ncbi:MAG: nitroreductase family protein [Selenomonadaceae bacterium]
MNNLLRNVLMRRSIYKFDSRQIKDEELLEILEEGKLLSNAANNQAWHFTVIQNRYVLKKLNEEASSMFAKESGMESKLQEDYGLLATVPMLLIISGRDNLKYAEDAANTVFGSMMLVAEKYGISSCWISSISQLFSVNEGKEVHDLISIPHGYQPLCVGTFGYKEAMVRPNAFFSEDNVVNIIK